MPVPANHVLAFGSDVPDIGPEADSQSGSNQNEGRGLDAKILPFVGVEQRRKEDAGNRFSPVVADRGEDDGPGNHGGDDCDDRRQPHHHPAGFLAFDQLNAHGRPR